MYLYISTYLQHTPNSKDSRRIPKLKPETPKTKPKIQS